jgi:caa(3)-type oxidase subunit IV
MSRNREAAVPGYEALPAERAAALEELFESPGGEGLSRKDEDPFGGPETYVRAADIDRTASEPHPAVDRRNPLEAESVDLGSQGNLVVAMVIATIKAGLVVAFFMHLVWDKKLHLILFLTSVLFLILFLSLSVNDRGEYQPDIDKFQSTATK